ncbi:MAG: pyridoxamine 5'-phosphate oxidase family protein [Pseudanabaenaceae cyanobacterium bins.68]|nr:pyridoxamine 5'-phosphate oxidase family protein [Pseudanabaenaceae cyanobacterium bins.68]
MAKFYGSLIPELQQFIAEQQMFFVATAPKHGRVNLSPKGIDSLKCLNQHAIAYLDLTGSGNETAAHLREDPRITLMFCSFGAQPLILRIYGQGQVANRQDPAWQDLTAQFPNLPGARQIILVAVDSVQTSCGFGVPRYEFVQQRSDLLDWATRKGEAGIEQYQRQKNQVSIDGLPTGLFE